MTPMNFFKRFLLFLLGLLVIILIAFWGFKSNFPGKSISNALQLRLTNQIGITFEIEALELEWTKFRSPKITLKTPESFDKTADGEIFVLENVNVPFLPLIVSRTMLIIANFHGGTIEAYANLQSQKIIAVSANGVKIENLPLVSKFPYAIISGTLDFSSKMENLYLHPNEKSKSPKGILKGKLRNSQIRIPGGTSMLNLKLPDIDFSEIDFDLQIGPLITIKEIKTKGSLEGTIGGTIKVSSKDLILSLIDLKIELLPSPKLREEISSFRNMLRSFQCGETIKINLKGSLNRLNFPTRGKC